MLVCRRNDNELNPLYLPGEDWARLYVFFIHPALCFVDSGRNQTPPEDPEAVITIGDIELHPGRRLVLKSGRPVHLTPKQFDLLRFLMCHNGRPKPHQRLLKFVWGNEYQGEIEYLRTFMSQIRKKIEDDRANPKYLLTDAYVGYRFSAAQ